MQNPKSINVEQILSAVQTWKDWEGVEDEIFQIRKWPKISKSEARNAVIVEGVQWMPSYSGYDIDRELEFLHEKLSYLVFNKLEPDAVRTDAAHPENFGKLCVICRMWTRERSIERCGLCKHELVPCPINEE